MIFDCHMHTPLCGHATGTPEQYVDAARARGVELLTFTCHVPMANPAFGTRNTRMAADDLPRYCEMIEAAREFGQEVGVRVLLGIEAEVFPDEAEMARMDETLAHYSFDFVLGSLHHQLPVYRERIQQRGLSSDAAIIADYFESLAYAATTGRYDSFAHPDLIRIYGTVKPFEPVQYESVIREFLSAAAENGTCIEVNTSGLTKGVFEIHPHPQILDWAQKAGVQLTLGSDAHRPDSVGQYFPQAYAAIHAAGFDLLCYFEAGRKTEVSIPS